MSLLEVRDLRAGYGIVEVLFGIDLDVDAGELVVVLGANGSGKTTTLRAISGMIAGRGEVRFDGSPPSAVDRIRSCRPASRTSRRGVGRSTT